MLSHYGRIYLSAQACIVLTQSPNKSLYYWKKYADNRDPGNMVMNSNIIFQYALFASFYKKLLLVPRDVLYPISRLSFKSCSLIFNFAKDLCAFR